VTPEITGDYEEWDSATGVVVMTADQYEKFVLDINKTRNGWVYIRVSIEESWCVRAADGTETVVATTDGTLSWDGDLLINGIDTTVNFRYVDGIVTENSTTISIIDGSRSNIAPTGITVNSGEELVVRLSIKVEAVQYNRADAFWGIDPDNDLN